jgi:hypothetical protein
MMVPGTPKPEGEARCFSSARRDLAGGNPVPTGTLNVLNPLGAIAMIAELLVAGRLCFVR